MKSRSEIWLCALEELGALCSVSTTHDIQTVMRRVESEGDNFFRVALPRYGKDFEQSLSIGAIPPQLYRGYSRRSVEFHRKDETTGEWTTSRRAVGTPKFLGGFQDLIFSVHSNDDWKRPDVVSDPSDDSDVFNWPRMLEANRSQDLEKMADAVAAIRQLSLMFAKEKELAPLPAQKAAIQSYVETDKELDNPLGDALASLTLFEGGRLERIRKVITLVFGQVLSDVDREVYNFELSPRHGSGSTSDRLYGNQKWSFDSWTDRLEHIFPYGVYALPNARFDSEEHSIKFLTPEEEVPTRVTFVPKTITTPRIIAMEPTCNQYMQQALLRSLVAKIESDSLASWFVGFTKQWPNQVMARIGSEDGSLATLDLSEASDRVANWLVEDLFANWPWFLEGLQACRSTKAQLPSGEVIPLLKFASMGSATTFPIEAMVFTSIVLERVLFAKGLELSKSSLRMLKDTVRVYGDDIIIPNSTAETVIDGLEILALKVNRHKSFWTGGFRESCGKEYWHGFDVSIVKVRSPLPSSLRNASEVVSTVSTRNQFYKAGLHGVAAALDEVLVSILKQDRYPIITEGSSLLGRVDDYISYDMEEWDEDLHTPLVRGYAVRSTSPINELDGPAALLKCLLTVVGSTDISDDHLERSGRPRVVRLKRAMGQPF